MKIQKNNLCLLFLWSTIFCQSQTLKFIKTEGKTIKTRFELPSEFVRTNDSDTSFGYFLRNLPLKPVGSLVKYYNGSEKANNNIYEAVINLPIGNKNLHQCADAVMRLRADYLYQQKKYSQIHFNFTNGFHVAYEQWRKGYRIAMKGNTTYWKSTTKPSMIMKTIGNICKLFSIMLVPHHYQKN